MKKLKLVLVMMAGMFVAVSSSDDNGQVTAPEMDRNFATNAA